MQWADDRSDTEATIFGSSSVVGADGKTAEITDQFATGLKWFNDGVWKDHFIPTKAAIDSDLLGKGNAFQSGNLAMADTHSWYTCCINPAAPAKPSFTWGVAATPSYNGDTTRQGARGHVQHPQHHPEPRRGVHGPRGPGRVARAADQLRRVPGRSGPAADARSTRSRSQLPGLEDRLQPSCRTPSATSTSPATRPGCPTTRSPARPCKAVYNKYRTTEGLDIDAELATLKTTLQGIFDEYYAANP